MNEEAMEKLAEMVDRLDNLSSAVQLPMPADLHVQCLRESLPELQAEAKEIYLQLGGENVWD